MIKHDLEKDLYIILFEGHLEANKILEKDHLLELETTIQNTCKINFHINIDENYIIFHGYDNNILNFNTNMEITHDSEFKEKLFKAICIIKNMLNITIKYGEITITECKEKQSYDRFQRIPGGIGYLHPFGIEQIHQICNIASSLPISSIPDVMPLDLPKVVGACERLPLNIDIAQYPIYKQYILYLKQT